jgi:hypothetical protein
MTFNAKIKLFVAIKKLLVLKLNAISIFTVDEYL